MSAYQTSLPLRHADVKSKASPTFFDNREKQENEAIKLLSVEELAVKLNVSVSWVYKRTKKIPSYRHDGLIRFDWAEVTAYFRRR